MRLMSWRASVAAEVDCVVILATDARQLINRIDHRDAAIRHGIILLSLSFLYNIYNITHIVFLVWASF